jgi:hypothetical protein
VATYFQFGPQRDDYQGRMNFLSGTQFSPAAMEYYQDRPQAQFALAMQGYPDSGQRAVSPHFRNYVEKEYLPDQYNRWAGQVGVGDQSQDFFLTDWAAKSDPFQSYLASNPYANRYARTARPTRLLRR